MKRVVEKDGSIAMKFRCGTLRSRVFLPMILIILSSPSIVSTSSKSFTLPIFHEEHPEIQRYLRSLKPESVSPMDMVSFKKVFYVRFRVGSTLSIAAAVFDSGSAFTWLQGAQHWNTSTSYRELSCINPTCANVPSRLCSDSNRCVYQFAYADGSTVTGAIGIDNFFFYEATESGHNKNSTIQFGLVYGAANRAESSNTHPGVMGVANGPLGILTALKVDRYSACFPISHKNVSYVRFGEDARLRGESIPIVSEDSHWLFSVNSLTVGGSIFNLSDGNDNITLTFDTGSAFTYLPPSIMTNVTERIMELVMAQPFTAIKGYQLCYDMDVVSTYVDIDFSFDIDERTSIYFDFDNIWIMVSNAVYCLTFLHSTGKNIFGVRQMQGRNFGLDLSSKRLYFDYC